MEVQNMKKILMILALLLTSSFAQTPVQKLEASQELYKYISSSLVCDIPTIEKLIKAGANVNYQPLLYEDPKYSMYNWLKIYKTPNCDKAAKFLKSNGVKSDEQLQAEWEAKQASNPKQDEQELLGGELMRWIKDCNMPMVKKTLERGANKDYIDKETGYSTFIQAVLGGNKPCAQIAYYLNSIGVSSIGITQFFVHDYTYDKPKVFENKHLKIVIGAVSFNGLSHANITNKTDEPIYIYAQTNEANGYKKSSENKRYPNTLQPDIKTKFLIYGYVDTDGDRSKYPKIINNHVKFNRQITIKYKYKDKEYELKTPIIQEEYDVKYVDVGIFG
jgi:hypothetical protein